MRLYHHRTDGGAEYLTDKCIDAPNGTQEGVFEGASIIVRIDGDIRKDAQVTLCGPFADPTAALAELRAERHRLWEALDDLTVWARTYTSPHDRNSPHKLLVAACAALGETIADPQPAVALRKQRDDLLAACQHADTYISVLAAQGMAHDRLPSEATRALILQLRAAIAAATAGD